MIRHVFPTPEYCNDSTLRAQHQYFEIYQILHEYINKNHREIGFGLCSSRVSGEVGGCFKRHIF
jgi:hypothetical protein